MKLKRKPCFVLTACFEFDGKRQNRTGSLTIECKRVLISWDFWMEFLCKIFIRPKQILRKKAKQLLFQCQLLKLIFKLNERALQKLRSAQID